MVQVAWAIDHNLCVKTVKGAFSASILKGRFALKKEGGGRERRKKELQTSQKNNCNQPLKLIRTKCQKQKFKNVVDVYSKTCFPQSSHVFFYLVLFSRTGTHSSRCGSKNEIRRTLVFWSKLFFTALVKRNRL